MSAAAEDLLLLRRAEASMRAVAEACGDESTDLTPLLAEWIKTAGADLWAHGPLCCAEGCMQCDDSLWMPHVRHALILAHKWLGEDT